ncbi:RNA polymerase sigma factor RpoE [Desulfocucumis palustris]|uniref:RNA polymerase sigma factor n=1 Tax=Desulfocucumis palustris TaxID=1898651 RepID=A0A2L2X9Y4_9FIRM|nr:RNA polymerase sigma factor [Desulfocucumis palustris]GBF32958.1 RNA polymerase sigma factor RpoE [Desulfocucumis palustris]
MRVVICLEQYKQITNETPDTISDWEEIVRNNQQNIYNLAYYLSGSPNEADDITQETFLKAFENLQGFRGESSLRTWLSRIATNIYLGKKRKQCKHQSISLGEMTVPDCSGNPERIVIRREMQWCIMHILKHHLPSRDYQVVLVLRDLHGLSYEEIASILSLPVTTVKSRLFRARRAYRDHLVKSGCVGLVKDYTCYCQGGYEL